MAPRYGIILGQNVNGPWGVSAGLPGRNDLQVYITCLKHVLTSLLRSAANPAITTQVRQGLCFPTQHEPQFQTLDTFAASHLQEELFAIALTLAGACVQATVFGQFAHLIASLDGQATHFKRQLSGIVDSMSYHGFPESLRVHLKLKAVSCLCTQLQDFFHRVPQS